MKSVLCREFKVTLPQTLEVMRGLCVTIPCSFDIESRYDIYLDDTCEAIWKHAKTNDEVVFQSSKSNKNKGQLKGNLRDKDCTTTLNTVSENSDSYYFRLECKISLKQNFLTPSVRITIIDNLPSPTLTPATLNVKEGSSVSLTCSAPVICLSHPPTLTWTPKLGESQETLQENQDKTTVKTSVQTFTASHLHHGQKISCTAIYEKLDGRTYTTPESSLTADVSYSPKGTSVSVSPSGPVPENSNVTLTCRSDANPPVKSYTWYRADGDQETFIGTEPVLNIEASKVRQPFFCKATNDLGVGRSSNEQIDVQYSPKGTSVSVSPSGPVPENSNVTLTCRSDANPPVKSYTWYRADGDQETFIGTEPVLNIEVSKVRQPFFCKTENDLGVGHSNNTEVDVQFPPQILPSSHCTRTVSQVSCSCETVGNPYPTLNWYLNGLPSNQSGMFSVIHESVNDTALRSIISVNQPQERDLPTLLCRSFNSLGSATQQFCVNCFLSSSEKQDGMMLPVFIIKVVILLILVCVLLFVIRFQRNHNKSPPRGEIDTVAPAQHLISEKMTVMSTPVSCNRTHPAMNSELDGNNLSSSGANDAEEVSKSSGKNDEDVIYSSVNWKTKSKKKRKQSLADVDPSGGSYMEEEKCVSGRVRGNFVSDALELGSLYEEVGPKNVRKEVESEYAQVQCREKNEDCTGINAHTDEK
ncbi:myelin-associated glycoprotein-like [Leuresthes tenuis]|uniref:myelin-associated glycoprotein-like n=1 Tax=Leuresthes tenuis TaxID=355514 RepID=UPI003B50CF72